MSDLDGRTDDEIITMWDMETDMATRDVILEELERRKLFPSDIVNSWEKEAGLYPDTNDKNFIQKLMKKQEFIENMQEGLRAAQERGDNFCDTEKDFELTSAHHHKWSVILITAL